jgi:hypothetical protein
MTRYAKSHTQIDHEPVLARPCATAYVVLSRPLADLRRLLGTCSTMHHVCGHGDVSRRLSIEGIRDEISWVWDPTAYKHSLLC